jgi:LacI family transcriptional regulator
MKKNITAKDIAKACGISQATVSYVMNDKEGKKISERTRNLVLETAKELDYIPNSSARGMRMNRAMSIGVVTGRNCITLGFNHVLRGVKRYTDQYGYSITLLSDEEAHENKNTQYIQYFRSKKIDAILFLFYDMSQSTRDLLAEKQIPYLVINENGVWGDHFQTQNTFTKVISECVDYCRNNHLKKIRFISTTYNGIVYSHKFGIFEKAIQKRYPEANFERIFFQGKTESNEEVVDNIRKYIKENDFDIAISPNQRLGLLTQNAILQNHFSMPQPIKHICLGSSMILQLMYPTITSLHIPLEEMGFYGASLLVDKIEGRPYEEKEFECEIEYGMSTQF